MEKTHFLSNRIVRSIRGNKNNSIEKIEEDIRKELYKYKDSIIYKIDEDLFEEMICKLREEQVRLLKEIPSVENLWQAVIAFQEYPFKTATGLPFRYKLKVGKNGEYNRELLIDRREKSKSLPGVVWCWHLKIVRGFQKK